MTPTTKMALILKYHIIQQRIMGRIMKSIPNLFWLLSSTPECQDSLALSEQNSTQSLIFNRDGEGKDQ